jgi:acetyl esterase
MHCAHIYNVMCEQDELSSQKENKNYFLSYNMLTATAIAYSPSEVTTKNILAWPYYARVEDLVSLPPHVISVNELDPLRDEGLEYFGRLEEAGVIVRNRVVKGTPHAGELMFRAAVPDIFDETLKDIEKFAKGL